VAERQEQCDRAHAEVMAAYAARCRIDERWAVARRSLEAFSRDDFLAVAGMQERMAAIRTEAASRKRVRVASVEWIEPLMVSGNWMPELIEMAGGQDLFGVAGEHAPPLAWEQILGADPDVILVLPCGFSLEQTRRDVPLLTARPGWGELSAVRRGRVFLCDGNQYFNRPGPRVVVGGGRGAVGRRREDDGYGGEHQDAGAFHGPQRKCGYVPYSGGWGDIAIA
jgi:hypothetical protein